MAPETALPDMLSSFVSATDSAIQGLPQSDSLLAPENGISLLDAKNEIFLSYLQALALRNLSIIRSLKDGATLEFTEQFNEEITAKLIEHRVYLERGVKPLEQKIKYQVDKVVKAADDEKQALAQNSPRKVTTNGRAAVDGGSSDDSEASSDGEGRSDASGDQNVDATSFRPNAAAFAKLGGAGMESGRRSKNESDGVYRPPRISATSMPTTDQRERKERRPARSATLDEYVSTELSNAPLAEPSIGSTIAAGGRNNKNARQLAKEQERREYEETNLIRLPMESKKEQAKQAGRDGNGGFGGEEWRGLGESVDRISDLTRKKGRDSALDKSRKRRATEDRPRDDGIGDAFEIKKRRLMKKMRP